MRCVVLPLLVVLAHATLARAQESKEPTADPVKVTLVPTAAGHVGSVTELIFIEDGKKLISCGLDRTVQVWDTTTGERLRVFHPPARGTDSGAIHSAVLSSDGKTLALLVSGVQNESGTVTAVVLLLNLNDGRVRYLTARKIHIHRIAFAPDGDRLAAGGDSRVFIWSGIKQAWDTAAENFAQRAPVVLNAPHTVYALAFSPDGKALAASCFEGHTVRWNLAATPPKQEAFGDRAGIDVFAVSAAFTPGGRLLTGDHVGVKLWSPTGKLERKFQGKDLGRAEGEKGNALVTRIMPLGENRYLAGWGAGGSQVGLSLLDAGDGTKCRLVYLSSTEQAFHHPVAAVAPGAGIAALGVGPVQSEIAIVSLADGKERLRLTGRIPLVQEIGWSKTGNLLAWGAATRKAVPVHPLALDGNELEIRTEVERGTCYHTIKNRADVKVARVGNEPWQLKITEGGKEVFTPKHNYSYFNYCLPPKEGRWLAWMTIVTLQVADRATGKTAARLSPGVGVLNLVPSPDGRYLYVAHNRQMLFVYRVGPDPTTDARSEPLLTLFSAGRDWVVWTAEGYYACSPGGEELLGALVFNGLDAQASFYPVARFRDSLYRPDVLKLVLEKGNVKDAVAAANDALKKANKPVPPSPAEIQHRLPPRVTKLVVDKSRLPVVTITAEAEAGSTEQPIKSLRVFVNGRPFPGVDGLKEYAPGKELRKGTVTFTLTLPDGKHQVAVFARSADAASISDEVSVDCRPLKERPVMHVLAVGVNKYNDKNLNLSCAVNDAELIATTFKKACEGDLFHKVRTTVLPNEKATRKTILGAIEDLRTNEKTKAKPGDLVVVFFAGHGAKQKDQFYLLTHEADLGDLGQSALSGAALREALKEFPCQVLLILDACHAAAFGEEDGKKGVLAAKNLRPATDDAAREFTRNEVGVIVFCAAMGYERAEERGSNGLFRNIWPMR